MEVRLQTKLAMFVAGRTVRRACMVLHRTTVSVGSCEDFMTLMKSRGWVVRQEPYRPRGPEPTAAPYPYKYCGSCSSTKHRREYANRKWAGPTPTCKSCCAAKEECIRHEALVRKQQLLADFVPPAPKCAPPLSLIASSSAVGQVGAQNLHLRGWNDCNASWREASRRREEQRQKSRPVLQFSSAAIGSAPAQADSFSDLEAKIGRQTSELRRSQLKLRKLKGKVRELQAQVDELQHEVDWRYSAMEDCPCFFRCEDREHCESWLDIPWSDDGIDRWFEPLVFGYPDLCDLIGRYDILDVLLCGLLDRNVRGLLQPGVSLGDLHRAMGLPGLLKNLFWDRADTVPKYDWYQSVLQQYE